MEALANNFENLRIGFQKVNCEDILKSVKMRLVERYLVELTENPRETKKSICARLNITPNTLNIYLREFGMGKLIRNKKNKNKGKKGKKIKGGALERGVSTISDVELDEKLKKLETQIYE